MELSEEDLQQYFEKHPSKYAVSHVTNFLMTFLTGCSTKRPFLTMKVWQSTFSAPRQAIANENPESRVRQPRTDAPVKRCSCLGVTRVSCTSEMQQGYAGML